MFRKSITKFKVNNKTQLKNRLDKFKPYTVVKRDFKDKHVYINYHHNYTYNNTLPTAVHTKNN